MNQALRPLAANLDELLSNRDWFADPARIEDSHATPPVIVTDDFYDDPMTIRERALACRFVHYRPPDPKIAGPSIHAEYADTPGTWRSTAFVTHHGRALPAPFYGERLNEDWIRDKLEALTGEPIIRESWPTKGDYWNGAFHLVEEDYSVGAGSIHHHFKPGDLDRRGWSGLVYLSPDAPKTAGTTIWRKRMTGRCIATFDEPYARDESDFELACFVPNRFNRLVLFRENVWHRLEHGFGTGRDARLTQTFFFEVEDATG